MSSRFSFSALYRATEEAMQAIKEPFVLNKNKRAVDSAIDSAETQKIDAEEKLEKELAIVAKGEVINVNKVLQLRQTIKNAELTVVELKAFKDEFFAKED